MGNPDKTTRENTNITHRCAARVDCAGFSMDSFAAEGNGGVPGVVGTYAVKDCATSGKPWCRKHGTGGGYGRMIAHNATHLTYEHVQNNGGDVTDTWTIVQNRHGPFAA